MTTASASAAAPVRVFDRVAVIGLGLIGGSIARRALAGGAAVAGLDGRAADAAAHAGITAVADVRELCGFAPDLVVVATPVRAMPTVFADLDQALGPAATVVDVASVKGPLMAELDGRLTRIRSQYLSVHPMAGTEQWGFEHSAADLLDGAVWPIVPAPWSVDAARFLRVADWLVSTFRARVVPISAADHDTAVALISQLPHVLANTLLAAAGESPTAALGFELAAGSFRDGTRVAGTDAERTEAMVLDNAARLQPLLDRMSADLAATARALRDGRPGDIFARAQQAYEQRQAANRRTEAPRTVPATAAGVTRLLEIGARGGCITALTRTQVGAELQVSLPTR